MRFQRREMTSAGQESLGPYKLGDDQLSALPPDNLTALVGDIFHKRGFPPHQSNTIFLEEAPEHYHTTLPQ